MSRRRIIQYPEATKLGADDYVLISNGEESYKFLAKSLGGGGIDLYTIQAKAVSQTTLSVSEVE